MHLMREHTGRHNAMAMIDAMSYRVPREVTKYRTCAGGKSYPVCPRCGMCIERESMDYCDRCGQRLGWKLFSDR